MCTTMPFLENPQLLGAGWGSRPLYVIVWSSLTEQSPAVWHFLSTSVYPGGYKWREDVGGSTPKGGISTPIGSCFPGDPGSQFQGLPARRQAAWAHFPISVPRQRVFLGNMGCPVPCPAITISANSAQWELCGSNAWPGSQDTWGQSSHMSHRALGKPLPNLSLLCFF